MYLWNQVKLFPNCKTYQGLQYANMSQNPSHRGGCYTKLPKHNGLFEATSYRISERTNISLKILWYVFPQFKEIYSLS